ncbi:hypothetical protein CVT25_000137 [Psilocybe cyanescens]|uniref:Uncharacterized protein n=1 Tax=Psilocybe cyanescens TaxID=93625 RepID=A0A409W1W4_PSICY|nr:hypothetical protein CVT25_000137 [Psilocybe cyanescens]
MPARSHEKPTTIQQWHRRLCHFGTRTIKEMASKGLVDGLSIIGPDAEVTGICEDCVYGKQTNRPYDEKVEPETELLERVHLDLWGPARVESVGGAKHPGIIPAERWFNKRQDVSHLRPIGSDAYAKIPKEVNPSKLDTVSIKYTLIGYYGRDAYKLLNTTTGEVIKSRNVVFEEGLGHRTQVNRVALHDEPIFEDELSPDEPHGTRHVDLLQAPVLPNGEDIPENVEGRIVVNHPYPIAPRHRAGVNNQPPRQSKPAQPTQQGQSSQPQEPELPRRSSRVANPSAASKDSAEFEAREETARKEKEDWATSRVAHGELSIRPH